MYTRQFKYRKIVLTKCAVNNESRNKPQSKQLQRINTSLIILTMIFINPKRKERGFMKKMKNKEMGVKKILNEKPELCR